MFDTDIGGFCNICLPDDEYHYVLMFFYNSRKILIKSYFHNRQNIRFLQLFDAIFGFLFLFVCFLFTYTVLSMCMYIRNKLLFYLTFCVYLFHNSKEVFILRISIVIVKLTYHIISLTLEGGKGHAYYVKS